MTTLLFIGDLVGPVAIDYLEAHLPALVDQYQPDFLIVNAENMELTFHPRSPGNCGLSPEGVARLFALGVDLITGGNHSWDGPYAAEVHADPRVLRPLNYGTAVPGVGAGIVNKGGLRLGVVNLVSHTAMRLADDAFAAFDAQAAAWGDAVDAVLVDFHGESVTEKLTFAYAVDGRAVAVLGTHTHVPTCDTRILPGGTAYVTDVGMTGPSEGMQGYHPLFFANSMRLRLPGEGPFALAEGPVELGAVVVRFEAGRASHIERVHGP